MGYKDHVVCVFGAEGRHAVADDGEQGYQDVVDGIDGLELLLANVDPADQEQNPG